MRIAPVRSRLCRTIDAYTTTRLSRGHRGPNSMRLRSRSPAGTHTVGSGTGTEMSDDRLVRLAEIAIADVDRMSVSLAATRVALAETDKQLASMRTGFVALKESLDRGTRRVGQALGLNQRPRSVRT